MRKLCIAIFCLVYGLALGQQFPIVNGNDRAQLLYDASSSPLDSVVSNLFADDVQRVTGYRPEVVAQPGSDSRFFIIVGDIKSKWIRQALADTSRMVGALRGQWECYGYQVVTDRFGPGSKALVVAGSDARGAAYGLFSLSERIGVSPWYWWADVPVMQSPALVIDQAFYVSKSPSVKFRGIFLNDEDWGLNPWAAKTFESEKNNIGPKTYQKIFELLLRLKANLIWPAMHDVSEPFFKDPRNIRMAEKYEIVIGSSHAEPMLRNNVGEWDKKTRGAFNYVNNKKAVVDYWEERAKEAKDVNAIYTMGMRGVHDSKMEGVKNEEEAVGFLEKIFEDQRNLLSKYQGRPASKIPQVFTAYKEVLDIYDKGLKVPDDITMVWPDDNYGYIHRLNTSDEQKRTGGSGVYYHASYWGRPHDYLWLGTTHPALIREEMMKAYDNGARQVWVLNVGDIKAIEYSMQLFLDMAFDAEGFRQSGSEKAHLREWVASVLGASDRDEIADVLSAYYDLAFSRRPEFMGWSQTEPTTKTKYTTFNHFSYGDEAQRRIDRYAELEKKVKSLRPRYTGARADAFYELVYYPVMGASLINKKFLYRDKAFLYSKQKRISAWEFASLSKAVHDSIITETNYYNEQLAGGKWRHMMSMNPRKLPVFNEPEMPAIKGSKNNGWDIAPEGFDTLSFEGRHEWRLPSFTPQAVASYFIDVFLTDSLSRNWKVKPSASWIKVSPATGFLSPATKTSQRIWVSVDWKELRSAQVQQATVDVIVNGEKKTVKLSTIASPGNDFDTFKGFVEKNHVISMHASHYQKKIDNAGNSWSKLDGLGYTGAAMQSSVVNKINELDTARIRKESPQLIYEFYSLSEVFGSLAVYSIPTHPLNKAYSMRYAVRIDNGPITVLDFKTVGRSEEWKQNVLRNSAIREVMLPKMKAGKHTLTIFAIDPGVILDRILIGFGNRAPHYDLIAETLKNQDPFRK